MPTEQLPSTSLVPPPVTPPVRAYVINLARSTDRRAHITAQLDQAGMSWELIEGVDAREVDTDQPTIVTAQVKAHPLFRPGLAGCALSHRRAYERILASGEDRAVVVEDDAILPRDFAAVVNSVAAEISGPEIVLLNFHHPEGLQLSTVGSKDMPGSRKLARPLNIENLTAAAAYVVTREACERLFGAMLPLRFLADEWWYFVREGVLEGIRCVAPMPVRQSPEFRTTIDHYSPGSVHIKLREALSRAGLYRAPVLRAAVKWKRERDFERWGAGRARFVSGGVAAAALRETKGPNGPS